jgi:hypothetical protein
MLSSLNSCRANSSFRKHHVQVAQCIQNKHFWLKLKHALRLLQPFDDLTHQIEADRPALGRVFEGLMQLDTHVRKTV